MEDINLHFTGDLHAISTANNLLSAMIDNHIWHGNELNINREEVIWNRCLDMNDRQLRLVLSGLGIKSKSMPRMDSYDITSASETMAIFCLASSIEDLKNRFSKAVVAYNEDGQKIMAKDFNVEGAMTALLRDAFNPNLVQTLEGTPAFVHGGPFANIAHGCSSLVATKMALKLSDYVVTEAGFGADLGAEKFLDIKCRAGNLKPSAAVVVATIKALKMHGGVAKENLNEENLTALEKGIPNLIRHVSNLKEVYKLPIVVALNKFETDTQKEIELVKNECQKIGVDIAISEAWKKGGNGGIELAEKVMKLCESKNDFQYAYELNTTIKEKIETIVKKIYHGEGVLMTKYAKEQMNKLEEMGYGNLPVCIAKTPYSFSDDPQKLGAPEDFKIKVDDVKVSAGAGFIVVLTEDVMTMPGLPKVPNATKIDVDSEGKITGIF